MTFYAQRCQTIHSQLQWLSMIQDLLTVKTRLSHVITCFWEILKKHHCELHIWSVIIFQCLWREMHQYHDDCWLSHQICTFLSDLKDWLSQCKLHIIHWILSQEQCFWFHHLQLKSAIHQCLLKTDLFSAEHQHSIFHCFSSANWWSDWTHQSIHWTLSAWIKELIANWLSTMND